MYAKLFATYSLLALMTLVFVIELSMDASSNLLALVKLGANVPVLVREGQWYRVLTANFLHLGFAHFYFNGIALFFLGALLERLLGARRFLLIFLSACIAGSALSTLYSGAMLSVGASAGIFGLLGGLGYLNLVYGPRLPLGFRQSWRWWLFILGINAVLPWLMPQIDWVAHLGGFIAGITATWWLGRIRDEQGVWIDTPALRRMLRLMLAAFIWAALMVPLRFDADGNRDIKRLLEVMAAQEVLDLPTLNFFAWNLATDPQADRALLETAYALMRATMPAPDSNISADEQSAYLDTLASLQYRLGFYQAAALNEYQALQLSPNRFYASQLSRFLARVTQEEGPVVIGPVQPNDLELRLTEANSRALLERYDSAGTLTVIVQVWHQQQRLGYLFCSFDEARQLWLSRTSVLFSLPLTQLRFELALIDSITRRPDVEGCNARAVDGLDYVPSEGW